MAPDSRLTLLAIAAALIFPTLAQGATRNVDKGNPACDDAVGTPFCTVQAAISAAGAGDRIEIAAGSYIETLTIDRNVTLAGAGISAVEGTCDGVTNLLGAPAVSVPIGIIAALTNLTVKGGAASFGGGISNAGVLFVSGSEVCQNAAFNQGAGIHTTGALGLDRVQVYDNLQAAAGVEGGGLFVGANGLAIVRNSSFTNNRATRGGGIAVALSGALALSRSTLQQNVADGTLPSVLSTRGGGISNSGLAVIDETQIGEVNTGNIVVHASGQGGGIFNDGILLMARSVLRSNGIERENPNAVGVGSGAGLHNAGLATISSSTVSGNLFGLGFPGFGAGIGNTGTLSLSNVTITDNSNGGIAVVGAGLYNVGGSATVRNSIIALQLVGDDCGGGVTTDGYNIDSDGTCGLLSPAAGGTDLPNVTDPGLLPFADYGGPTRTHNLADDSPAIDGGNPAGCNADPNGLGPAVVPLLADQRGNIFVEVSGVGGDPSGCDIGAVEFNLLANGMMEDDKDSDNVPDGWTGANLVAPDDLYCLPRRIYASRCAFGVLGDPSQVKQLAQSVDRAGGSGDLYSLTVFSSGTSVAGTPQVRVQFDDLGSPEIDEEFVVPLTLDTYLYQGHNLDITTTGSYDRITVTIEAGTGGGLFIDDVSLVQRQ